MTTTFNDMNEAKQYVREDLQEFVHEYGVDAIAAEITDQCNGKLTMVVSRAEQIIRKRIAKIQDNMDSIIDYEVESESAGVPIPEYERKQNDKRWGELFDRKVELIDILAEIMEVDYMTTYHSL